MTRKILSGIIIGIIIVILNIVIASVFINYGISFITGMLLGAAGVLLWDKTNE